MDIPENTLEQTLKRGFELIEEIKIQAIVEAPVVRTESLLCPICGFTAKSKLGLMSHKKTHE